MKKNYCSHFKYTFLTSRGIYTAASSEYMEVSETTLLTHKLSYVGNCLKPL